MVDPTSLHFFAGMDRSIGVESGNWLAVTSISFDISALELLWTLTRGFKVVIHGEGNTDKIPAEILRHGITHLQLTPSLLRALVSEPRSLNALGKLKKILIGGEVLPGSLVASLRQSFTGEIYNMYGPTETAIWSTVHRVQEPRTSIPIGKPIVNTQVYVLDSHHQLVPPGGTGNLLIGGDGVVRGYLNQPDLTAERFVSDPFRQGGRLYRTGDLARFLPDGNLEFVGRADFQVKIRGFRIELGEIEATLEQQPGVEQAVVVAREDRHADKILAAYVVAKPGESVNPDSLRSALEAALPNYMVPSHFVLLESLPLTANGKIDRNALPPISLQIDTSSGAGEDPSGEFEQVLAKAWAEALGAEANLPRRQFLPFRRPFPGGIEDRFQVSTGIPCGFPAPDVCAASRAQRAGKEAGRDGGGAGGCGRTGELAGRNDQKQRARFDSQVKTNDSCDLQAD